MCIRDRYKREGKEGAREIARQGGFGPSVLYLGYHLLAGFLSLIHILIVEYIWPIVIITLAILLGQVIFGTGGVLLSGQPLKVAMQCRCV